MKNNEKNAVSNSNSIVKEPASDIFLFDFLNDWENIVANTKYITTQVTQLFNMLSLLHPELL